MHTYTALWTGRNKHLLVQGSRDNNKAALVFQVDGMRHVNDSKLKMEKLTKLSSLPITVYERS